MMINYLTALAIWVLGVMLNMRPVIMFGPLLARAITPVFWIYMSPKLRDILASTVRRRSPS